MDIKIDSQEEKKLLKQLEGRKDADSKRMQRFLEMPDLSRQKGSPIAEIVERSLKTKSLSIFHRIRG